MVCGPDIYTQPALSVEVGPRVFWLLANSALRAPRPQGAEAELAHFVSRPFRR
jgi:hypothetical protein